jgi:putative transposase
MIIRELKLKPTKKQIQTFEEWLNILTGVYNFGIRKIELNAKDKIYFSKFEFVNICSEHSKKLGIPSHTIQATLDRSYTSWQRCFKKQAKKPKLKSIRNKLRSIPFPDVLVRSRISKNKIILRIIGKIKYFKQQIPEGQIKNVRIIKRSSGWYCQLCIDTNHIFPVKETTEKVGIDTGFKTLVTLSNGIKYDNKRVFVKGQQRLAQAQRGKNKKLIARLHERISNRRKDYNHKVSRELVENYSEIYITNDNLRGQSKIFGKSVADAGISQLRNFIIYKGDKHGRKVKLVNSKNTTMTCSSCGFLTGPKGLNGLDVRNWECELCGVLHCRDVNAAKNILNSGLGCNLVNLKLTQEIIP